MTEAQAAMLDNAAAYVLFVILVLGIYAIALLSVLFAGLLVRAIWRWLTRHTWSDVIVSTERKALR